ncbi:MAG: hypothetical protein JWM98_2884, partial [Thermoleophilia bacterium]|nr:hypothetical protein [Thermoleophilia bacterium]
DQQDAGATAGGAALTQAPLANGSAHQAESYVREREQDAGGGTLAG